MKYYRAKEEMNIRQTIKRRKANWIGYILRRNCFLKHVIEEGIKERVDVMGRRGRRLRSYWITLRTIERGSTVSQYVGNSLWKRLWTCREIDKKMNEYVYILKYQR
jgi:hypothetical protein